MKTAGIRFRRAGRAHEFDQGELELRRGMRVIVDTANGLEIGSVVYADKEKEPEEGAEPLDKVLRVANAEDLERDGLNREKEKSAYAICEEKIAAHGLAMKLVAVEYTFENNKILFYFTADNRVDFRELVKDLASVFRTRIELRQIGVRDETKILGGFGPCGRILCCHSYLSEFQPVSIRMAKDQNLSLNPTKISGVCGRLMCCLKNEQESYEYLNSRMPGMGDTVVTEDGKVRGTVTDMNVLRQTVKVLISGDDDTDIREFKVDDLRFKPRRRRGKVSLSPEEMKEVAELEQEEKGSASKLD